MSVLVYDTKQSDSEASEMLELWGMWSTSSLPSLPGPLWPVVVAPDRVLSIKPNQTEPKQTHSNLWRALHKTVAINKSSVVVSDFA